MDLGEWFSHPALDGSLPLSTTCVVDIGHEPARFSKEGQCQQLYFILLAGAREYLVREGIILNARTQSDIGEIDSINLCSSQQCLRVLENRISV